MCCVTQAQPLLETQATKNTAAIAKAQAHTRNCNKWNRGVQTVNKDKDGNEKYDKSNEIWSYEKLQAIEFVNILVYQANMYVRMKWENCVL